MGWDIDLLVPLDSVAAAAAVLEVGGLSPSPTGGPAGPRAARPLAPSIGRNRCGSTPDGRLTVELHSEAQRQSDAPSGGRPRFAAPAGRGRRKGRFLDPAHRRALRLSLRPRRLERLVPTEMDRRRRRPARRPARPRRSSGSTERSQGWARAGLPAQALLLCERLFATPLPPALAAELRSDRMNRWLLAIALRKLAGRTLTAELTRSSRHRHHPPHAIRPAARARGSNMPSSPPARQPRRPGRGAAAARLRLPLSAGRAGEAPDAPRALSRGSATIQSEPLGG
jgi:hypothetical protein